MTPTDYPDLTDKELLARLSHDDREAFAQIFHRWWDNLYQLAFYATGDEHISMDIVQDVFTWLWEKRAQYQIDIPGPYLRAAVKFKVSNHFRAGRVHAGFLDHAAATHTTSINTAEEELELRQLQMIINKVVEALPSRCREVYRLSRDSGLSNKEIAAHLDITVKTVENQMTIALDRIRTAMASSCILLALFSQS